MASALLRWGRFPRPRLANKMFGALVLLGCRASPIDVVECNSSRDCDGSVCSALGVCMVPSGSISVVDSTHESMDTGPVIFIDVTSDCSNAPFFEAPHTARYPLQPLDRCPSYLTSTKSPCLSTSQGSVYFFKFRADPSTGDSTPQQEWEVYAYTPYTSVAIYVLDSCDATSCSNDNTAVSPELGLHTSQFSFLVPAGETRIVAVYIDSFCNLLLPLVDLRRLLP